MDGEAAAGHANVLELDLIGKALILASVRWQLLVQMRQYPPEFGTLGQVGEDPWEKSS
jgi:hypothetical protein